MRLLVGLSALAATVTLFGPWLPETARDGFETIEAEYEARTARNDWWEAHCAPNPMKGGEVPAACMPREVPQAQAIPALETQPVSAKQANVLAALLSVLLALVLFRVLFALVEELLEVFLAVVDQAALAGKRIVELRRAQRAEE